MGKETLKGARMAKKKPEPRAKSDRAIIAIMEDMRNDRDAAIRRAKAAESRADAAEEKVRTTKMTADLAESRAAALGQRDAEIRRLTDAVHDEKARMARIRAAAVECVTKMNHTMGLQ